jgi:hypothetical protein
MSVCWSSRRRTPQSSSYTCSKTEFCQKVNKIAWFWSRSEGQNHSQKTFFRSSIKETCRHYAARDFFPHIGLFNCCEDDLESGSRQQLCTVSYLNSSVLRISNYYIDFHAIKEIALISEWNEWYVSFSKQNGIFLPISLACFPLRLPVALNVLTCPLGRDDSALFPQRGQHPPALALPRRHLHL